jgi:acyl-CoA reductase-like NAD-dependent aldehyde dehydrogenase
MTRRCSEDEAVELANVMDFGLGGAVWSTDEERAIRVAEQLEVGMANVNNPAGEGADLPFGGTKCSGFGRELGRTAWIIIQWSTRTAGSPSSANPPSTSATWLWAF